MAINFQSSEVILNDLQEIYLMALEKGNFSVAVKIKELLGREVGLFVQKNSVVDKSKLSLDFLSEEDIIQLVMELEAKLGIPQK